MFVSPPVNSYVEILTLKVMISDGVFGIVIMSGISGVTKETPRDLFLFCGVRLHRKNTI
jgi:hypothetical protein